jgi:hypothetical protein
LFVCLLGVDLFVILKLNNMEAYTVDAKHKDHVVSVFDGQSMDHCVWVKKMEFYLLVMANGLCSGLLDDKEPGDKKTLLQRQLACYGIININLSDSC